MTVIAAPQQFQRAVRGLPFMASYTFGLNDEALPDAAPTVAVANAAGALVATGTSTLGVAAGGQQTATYALPAAALPARDFYTVTWSYAVLMIPTATTSTIDVCDQRLFAIADYAQYPELAAKGFTAAQYEQARFEAENRLEDECGRAFTGRYGAEAFTLREPSTFASDWPWTGSAGRLGDPNVTRLSLAQPFVQALRDIQQTTLQEGTSQTPPVDSTTVTHLDLSCARLDAKRGIVYWRDPKGDGLGGDVVVSYEHGQPVADARRICAMLARHRLLLGPLDSRATQAPVEGGGSINLATPGLMGSVFGIPEIDVFIVRHSQRAVGYVSSAV